MEKFIIYDTEIIKCIPSSKQENDLSFSYCEGWRDFPNMGISVICAYISQGLDYPQGFHDFVNYENSIPGYFPFFADILAQEPLIIGFDSKAFDDNLLRANEIEIESDYDLLELVRLAAYGSISWQDQPEGYTYSLDAIARANGLAKSGSGTLAPVLWQQEKFQEVIDYCLNDVKITKNLWDLAIKGELIDPNNQQKLDISQFVEDYDKLL
jgi:hypothetical protein